MNFRLTNLDAIEQKYGNEMAKVGKETWQVNILCCGCSGDCGSNWMRS